MSEHKYKEAYEKGYEDGKKHAFDGWVEQCYDELPKKEQIELLMKRGADLPFLKKFENFMRGLYEESFLGEETYTSKEVYNMINREMFGDKGEK